MNKKVFISIIVIFVLLLIAGGVFLWWRKEKSWNVYKYTKPESYIIRDTSLGRVVENIKAGLKMKVPKDWKVEIRSFGDEGIVNFLSINSKIDTNGRLEEGISVSVEIFDCSKENSVMSLNLQEVKNIIDIFLKDPEKLQGTNYKVKEINNLKVVEEFNINNVAGRDVVHISVRLPFKSNIYEFRGIIIPNQKDLISEFDKFLEGVIVE